VSRQPKRVLHPCSNYQSRSCANVWISSFHLNERILITKHLASISPNFFDKQKIAGAQCLVKLNGNFFAKDWVSQSKFGKNLTNAINQKRRQILSRILCPKYSRVNIDEIDHLLANG
jgi:hypothetical protein